MNVTWGDNYIDATNTFVGGGGGDTIINGQPLENYIYVMSNTNLYIHNPNSNGIINLTTYTNPNNVKIDIDGRLKVYHDYDILLPTIPSGWYDVKNEIVGGKFNDQGNTIAILALGADIALINTQLETIEFQFTVVDNRLLGLELLTSAHTDLLSSTMTTETYEQLVNTVETLGDWRDVFDGINNAEKSFYQRIIGIADNVYGTIGGVGFVAGVIGTIYSLVEGEKSYNLASNVSNVNFEIPNNEREYMLQSNVSNQIIYAENLLSSFSNFNIHSGFINSNIITTQFVPSLKSNKVLLGNITTPNSSYQMEMTGDLNANEYYRNSVSLTSLLAQKQDNMSATQPIYITTSTIGLNYDSSLTKVGNNLKVVKTATAPLKWTGNDISLDYDSTLLNNSGSLGVSISAESKWGFTGANIYNKAKTNVGIGTDSGLIYKLNVVGDSYFSSNVNIATSKLNFISSYTTATLTQVTGVNEYYLQYTANGTLVLNEPCACDLLVVGAGGNGGTGNFSGGGGAGEVIYYPNFPLRSGTLNIQVGASSTNPTNRISRIYPSSGNEVIRALGGGNGATPNNQSLLNLFQNKKPWGMYFAEDWSGTTLLDKSGNGRHATTSGITKIVGSGNGATGNITYLTGTTTSTITWPSGSIPSTFTIVSLTRYNNSINQVRVLQGTDINWLHGHLNGYRGATYYGNGFKSNGSTTNATNWVCTIGKNDSRVTGYANNILVDGVASGIETGGTGNSTLTINNSTFGGTASRSDFAFSFVMIWDQHLTDAEMVLLNNMIDQYKTDGIYIPNVINSYTNATSGGSGGGGIVGTNSLGAVAGVKFDDYKSFAQAGLNGTSTSGGGGGSGSSTYNTRFTTTITGTSLSVGLGGNGATTSSIPVTKTNYGDAGDGNGGIGIGGIIIIRFKEAISHLQLKAVKDNGNTGLILNANETVSGTTTPYQLRIFPWSDTYTTTGIVTRGWSFRTHDGLANQDLLNLFSYFGGRVGIKTKNPTAVFDVNGDIACKTFSVVGNELYGITCQVVNQHDTGEANITISAGASGNYGAMSVAYLPSENLGYISCSKSLQIKTQSAGSYIHIDNTTGNIGIGNNAPTYKLVVAGTIGANDIMVSGSINATTLGIGQVYATGIDNGYFNNLDGSIVNNKYLYSSNIYVNNFIDCQNKPIYNCSILYGTADIAKEWKPVTNYWHKDDQGRQRFYFRNDPSAGVTDHYTMIKSGSYTIYFRDKDDTDYLSADRFGLDTYFPVTTSTTDYLAVVEPNASGTWQYRRMMIKYGSFTEFHRVFVDDDLYVDYDDFMNNYVGRVVVSTGKTKHAKKEPGDIPWEILEDKDAITIDDAQPVVQLSRQRKDKRVYGVITYRQVSDYGGRICVNALGEGGIWVINTNGDLENGDYLQTSNEIGYAEKQDDDILRNYTIAKIIMDCTFELDSPKYKCEVIDETRDLRRAFVGCVYYCG